VGSYHVSALRSPPIVAEGRRIVCYWCIFRDEVDSEDFPGGMVSRSILDHGEN